MLDTLVLAPARIAWNDWRARVGLTIKALYLLMGTLGVVVEPPAQGGLASSELSSGSNIRSGPTPWVGASSHRSFT